MDPRTRKQIIIILVFVFLILIIAVAIYFLFIKPAPTCTDSKQNQEEEGIDCGGPCLPCEIKNLKSVQIIWVKALHTTAQNYDLVALISNLNQNYGSRKVDYEFKLYDLNDKLLGSKSGTTFILPREEKYIVELKINSPQPIAKVKLNIGEVQWEKIQDYQVPQVDIFDKHYETLKSTPIYSQAWGTIKNSGHFNFKNVKIIAVLYDDNREPLAVNVKEIESLVAGQERYFLSPWLFEIIGNVANIDIVAQVNIFN